MDREVLRWWLRASVWELNQRGAYEMSSSGRWSGDGIGGALCSPVKSEGEQRRAEFGRLESFGLQLNFAGNIFFLFRPFVGLACIVSTSPVSV